jgi:hypothetical protein
MILSVSKAQQKAVAKYMKGNYDEIKLRFPKGKKKAIQEYAKSQNKSVNKLICNLIDADMSKTGAVSEINNYILDDAVRNMLKKLYLSEAKGWRRDAKDYHRYAAEGIEDNADVTWEMMEQQAIKFANVFECLAKELKLK